MTKNKYVINRCFNVPVAYAHTLYTSMYIISRSTEIAASLLHVAFHTILVCYNVRIFICVFICNFARALLPLIVIHRAACVQNTYARNIIYITVDLPNLTRATRTANIQYFTRRRPDRRLAGMGQYGRVS